MNAAVRIAMTVAQKKKSVGKLYLVAAESDLDSDNPQILMNNLQGSISSDLKIGADVVGAAQLKSNFDVSHQGVTPLGGGFRLSESELILLGYDPASLPSVIKSYVIGRDLVQRLQTRYIIDFLVLL